MRILTAKEEESLAYTSYTLVLIGLPIAGAWYLHNGNLFLAASCFTFFGLWVGLIVMDSFFRKNFDMKRKARK